MRTLLGKFYTWTGIHVDTVRHYSACPECQHVSRRHPKVAPLQEVPVITEPWERVAFDLVGPLPRAKDGSKYVLTTVRLASKYPEALPLKEISAEAVAEGMLEIWSRTGIPKEILTDQGTQFMSKLLKQLCSRLRIKMARSSPYLPQSNGALERFHGTLVPMLRKLTEDHGQWPRQLKFCLYAMRAMPHRDTGFSPFEVVYGRNLHTPLELLYDSWFEYPLTLPAGWRNLTRR